MTTFGPFLFAFFVASILASGICGQFSWIRNQKPPHPPPTHQPHPVISTHEDDSLILTRLNGNPISDKYNVETAGPMGPLLAEDGQYIEEISHFTRERIPERTVFAKGYGAFGYFKPTNTKVLARYTKAPLFTVPDVTTKVAVRFSTAIGSRGSSDTVRDVRGFAIKFYSTTGNFDLLTINIPVFFIRDPLRFIYFVHSQKPDPVGNWRSPQNIFSYIVSNPEILHSIMYIYSDAGIPDGYRYLPGFSINTFRLTNSAGGMVYARFNLVPDLGIKNLNSEEVMNITDPSYAAKDLFNAIKAGNYPSWTLRVQIMDAHQAKNASFDILDVTKIWYENLYPSIEIGKLALNRNPENEFAEIEQLAFKPSNLINGINPSPDKLIQGRILAYIDAHNYRLGANNYKLPVNAPIRPIVNPTTRDGAFVCDSNLGSTPNFLPNTYSPQYKLAGQFYADIWSPAEPCTAFRYNTMNEDNYIQAGEFWTMLKPHDQENLVKNLGMDLLEVSRNLQIQVIKVISNANLELAERLSLFLLERSGETAK